MRVRALILLFLFSLIAAGSADAASVVSISSPGPEGAEGNILTTNFNFTVTRSGDLTSQCVVGYETREGSAYAPEDYTAVSGTVTFAAGQSSIGVPIAVIADIFVEMDETFSLALTSAAGDCSLSGTPRLAVIYSDEPPAVPNGCANGVEGDIGIDAALRVDDLIRTRRFVLGLDVPGHACIFQKADINENCGDGRIDGADVSVLRQWILQGGVQRRNCGPMEPVALGIFES